MECKLVFVLFYNLNIVEFGLVTVALITVLRSKLSALIGYVQRVLVCQHLLHVR
jgi:hypothetical protein